ncbi:MAG: IS1595 family transposase [Candidatus Moranbacteria bacterium]|nr:IS1595 family transposase [Candidatus Moranbacteria bacterium]
MQTKELYKICATQSECIKSIEQARWHGKPECPYCHSKAATAVSRENRYHCNACNTSFSATVGTIFHKTKIDFQKWFWAISLIINNKNHITSRNLSRIIGVSPNTGWFMLKRINNAIKEQNELIIALS